MDSLEETDEDLHHLQWVAYGVIAPVIIAIGLFGNVANLFVLSRPNLKSVTYVYLMWLAIADLLCQLFIIPSLLKLSASETPAHNSATAFYHAHVELALINGLMAASVFLVVAVTVDRYVSISKPTKFKKIHTYRRARINIVAACVSAVLLNLPMCFYKRVVTVERVSTTNPLINRTIYNVMLNSQVVSTYWWAVYLWGKEILTRLAPAVLLAVLNIIIIRRFLQLVKKRRQRLQAQKAAYRPVFNSTPSSVTSSLQESSPPSSSSAVPLSSQPPAAYQQPPAAATSSYSGGSSGGGGGGSFHEEKRLVMLLAAIVVMFLVAMTPAAFLSLYNSNDKSKDYYFQMFRAFANDMEFLNYALNFYVYCLCSSEIRRTFLQMLTCGRWKGAALAAEVSTQQPQLPTPQQHNLGLADEPQPPRKYSSPSIGLSTT